MNRRDALKSIASLAMMPLLPKNIPLSDAPCSSASYSHASGRLVYQKYYTSRHSIPPFDLPINLRTFKEGLAKAEASIKKFENAKPRKKRLRGYRPSRFFRSTKPR